MSNGSGPDIRLAAVDILPEKNRVFAESLIACIETSNRLRAETRSNDAGDCPVFVTRSARKLATKRVVNLVCSLEFSGEVDIHDFVFRVRNSFFAADRPEVLSWKLVKPKCTVLLFKHKKLLICGLKTLEEARSAARVIGAILREVSHVEVKLGSLVAETFSVTANLGFPLRLEKLSRDFSPAVTFEPDVFAGAVWRLSSEDTAWLICRNSEHYEEVLSRINKHSGDTINICFSLFVSGKCVITGLKSLEYLDRIINVFYIALYKYSF